ncbi:hypothetical protein AB0E06_10190 [Streptomyces sp. NPDC048109]|uniref:hypothetical protein n=1 Tax=Streptomyces sp. NPDC048109 TaxID=3155482 RepID=UPI00341C2C53
MADLEGDVAVEWGDAATWVACGAAIVAAVYSAKSARTAAASLKIQQQALAPVVEWRLERDDPAQQWGVFLLRNVGTLDAQAVTVTYPREVAPQVDQVDIPAGVAEPVVIAYDMSERQATHLMLTWRGQAAPVAVAIPPLAG